MLMEWWVNLSSNIHSIFIIFLPLLIFFMDMVIKNGFGLNIDTAGCDLCLVAIGLDITQISVFLLSNNGASSFTCLLFIVIFAHIFIWVTTLWIVSKSISVHKNYILISITYMLGILSVIVSVEIILEFVIGKGFNNG